MSPQSSIANLVSVAVIGNELALSWNDSSEQYIALTTLRTACPCALCCGEAELTRPIAKPLTSLTKESFQLKSYEFVGGYALQFHWNDGHRTGIYSYSYLKML